MRSTWNSSGIFFSLFDSSLLSSFNNLSMCLPFLLIFYPSSFKYYWVLKNYFHLNLFFTNFRSFWCHWWRKRSICSIFQQLGWRSQKNGSKRKTIGFQRKRRMGTIMQFFECSSSRGIIPKYKWFCTDEKVHKNQPSQSLFNCYWSSNLSWNLCLFLHEN